MNREICNVITKGTFVDSTSDSYEPRHVLVVKKVASNISICFFDIATLKFFLGKGEDDLESLSLLRTICSQIRPVEVLIEREMRDSEILKLVRNQPCPPVINLIPSNKCWSKEKTFLYLDRLFDQ